MDQLTGPLTVTMQVSGRRERLPFWLLTWRVPVFVVFSAGHCCKIFWTKARPWTSASERLLVSCACAAYSGKQSSAVAKRDRSFIYPPRQVGGLRKSAAQNGLLIW